MQRILCHEVNVKEDIPYGMVLKYYVISGDSALYGIAVEKLCESGGNVFREERQIGNLFPVFDMAAELCEKLFRNRVTPVCLEEIVREELLL